MKISMLSALALLLAAACNDQQTVTQPAPGQALRPVAPPPAGNPVAATAPVVAVEPAKADDDDDEEEEGEEAAALADLPGPAQDAIKRVVGQNPIKEVEKETRDGVTHYEAEFVADGVTQTIVVGVRGELVELEKEIAPGSLPQDVRAAVAKRIPGGVIKAAEAVHVGGAVAPTYYEVDVKNGGAKTKELKLRPSGEIVDNAR